MSSGNSLDCSPEDMSQLHANEAAVKEMEAAGISWVRPGCIRGVATVPSRRCRRQAAPGCLVRVFSGA